jgi:molybdopterin molybdotransferase
MTHPTIAQLAAALPDYDAASVPVALAQDLIAAYIAPLTQTEEVGLLDCPGRVLARDVVSPFDVPGHDNSAMDGYALRAAELGTIAPTRMPVVGSAFAGQPYDGPVAPGECVRIMTGAVMPADCDTVVPQELVRVLDGAVEIAPNLVRAGENRRKRGEDLAAGGVALAQGRVLRASDAGLLASLGIARVTVMRRLRVAIFSTGDELRALGEPLDAGCVHDSNRYTLHAMLKALGCEVVDLGIVRDDPALLEAALREGAARADAIVTSGGVSVGEADYTRQVMAALGDCAFWTVAMRPGRPMTFGRIEADGTSAYLFGLPGNPVAVMVTFLFFARDALLRLMGARQTPAPLLRARTPAAIRKKPGRTEYQRAVLARDADGQPYVRLTGAQGSGILSSMSAANCIVVLGHAQGPVEAGGLVDVAPFDGLL